MEEKLAEWRGFYWAECLVPYLAVKTGGLMVGYSV